MIAADFIGQIVEVQIDRPLGSRHPEYGFEYPINYGFVAGQFSGDGEELDAYVLGVGKPLASFRGRCIAVIHRLNDKDDKLVVLSDGVEISDEQIRQQTSFQERYFESTIRRTEGT
ncbi:inorganic diphosphatase [Verrucomicrobiota bacterium sgz303538]